jgi:hypothetical protein
VAVAAESKNWVPPHGPEIALHTASEVEVAGETRYEDALQRVTGRQMMLAVGVQVFD